MPSPESAEGSSLDSTHEGAQADARRTLTAFNDALSGSLAGFLPGNLVMRLKGNLSQALGLVRAPTLDTLALKPWQVGAALIQHGESDGGGKSIATLDLSFSR